jgi:hypothetical protein
VPSITSIETLANVPTEDQFTKCLPVYSLAAAAGGFSGEHAVRSLGWVEVRDRHLSKDMFVARVKGKSMEPIIPDNSWCIFRTHPGGSRVGNIVLVQCNSIADPETSGRFTVKRYHSEKEMFDDGTWRHKQITLTPANPAFQPILLENVEADSFRDLAEWVTNLP